MDGDGATDALVGVVKRTRYDSEMGRRIFIFHLAGGKVRPLWMGSRLGGRLIDFCYVDGRIRAMEASADGRYSVSDWQWKDFGLQFERYLIRRTDSLSAQKTFKKVYGQKSEN